MSIHYLHFRFAVVFCWLFVIFLLSFVEIFKQLNDCLVPAAEIKYFAQTRVCTKLNLLNLGDCVFLCSFIR
jgi:hypothetical protein